MEKYPFLRYDGWNNLRCGISRLLVFEWKLFSSLDTVKWVKLLLTFLSPAEKVRVQNFLTVKNRNIFSIFELRILPSYLFLQFLGGVKQNKQQSILCFVSFHNFHNSIQLPSEKKVFKMDDFFRLNKMKISHWLHLGIFLFRFILYLCLIWWI